MGALGLIPVVPINSGGNKSSLNVAAAAVIKNGAGTLKRIVVQAVGSSGTLTINDLASTSGGAAANEIGSWTTAQLTTILADNGGVIELDWPCATGIAVTVCSGGIVANISYS